MKTGNREHLTALLTAVSLIMSLSVFAQEKAADAKAAAPAPAEEKAEPLEATEADAPAAEAATEADAEDGKEKSEDEEYFIGVSVNEELGIEEEEEEGPDLINISVEEETLDNVVQMFAKMSDVNIIATSTNLTGTVTVNLKDVEWKPALSSILAIHNLALIERTPGSGVYMIQERVEGQPLPLVVETIFLDYTTVGEVAPVIKTMIVANGSVSSFAERNALVVRTTEPNLEEIKKLIDTIDISSKQVSIEAKFMELNDKATKSLGLKWGSLAAFKMQLDAGPFSRLEAVENSRSVEQGLSDRILDRQDNTLLTFKDNTGKDVILTSPSVFTDALDQNTVIDANKLTVKANPGLIPTLGSDTENQGEDRGELKTSVQSTFTFGNLSDTAPNLINNSKSVKQKDAFKSLGDTFIKSISESQSTVLSLDTLELVLSALSTTDGVSIISNPKMVVANGTTNAFFRVGNRWPIIRTQITSGTADSPGDAIDARLDLDIDTDYISGGYLRTGIELLVVPVVKTENLIQAEITPTLTSRIGDKVVGGNSWPELQVKEIKTRFTLQSGQTVAIGGLTSSRDSKIVNKVPFLGDIPLLGKYLFTHTEDGKEQVETIIFVTLALAEPENLKRETGMPEDTELTHIRLLKDAAKREKFTSDLERMREAADIEKTKEAESILKRLKKNK